MMNKFSNILSLLSYNCHGFNQGKPYLTSICASDHNNSEDDSLINCIFLQELWLTPENLQKIANFSRDYVFYGISAMEKAVSSSVLIGRPYGGVGTLVSKKLCQRISFSQVSERFVIVALDKTLLVNVYLPSVKTENDKLIFLDVLASIECVLSKFSGYNIVLGGDLNLNLVNNADWAAKTFSQFMCSFNLLLCDSFLYDDNSIKYSFSADCHGKLSYSLIDYFVVSRCLFDSVQNCTIVDSAINMSDHNPVLLHVSDCLNLTSSAVMNDVSNDLCMSVLRWDHSDLAMYYNCTFDKFTPLWRNMKNYLALKSNNPATNTTATSDFLAIERFYSEFINSLNCAANKCIRQKRVNFFKYWWDAECDVLKEKSIETHRVWINAGRPRMGETYSDKCRSKLAYKSYLINKEKSAKSQLSADLLNSLASRDSNNFWKIWNSKTGNFNPYGNVVDGITDSKLIAEKFATYFASVYKQNNKNANKFKMLFRENFKDYTGDKIDISIEVFRVDEIIRNLKRGKAAGLDKITCEHLQFAHPIVCSCLTMLFNLIISTKYVPEAFGRGILVPIPKGDKRRSHTKIEEYRGITVSCLISKIFESCLLFYMKSFFVTSDRQFGFKEKVGCSNAIYSFRKTVEYFTTNCSTVNICSLDLSKAFDMINIDMLFSKLINRKLPRWFIETLRDWYSKLDSCVRWKDQFSTAFAVTSGVRQGGILSPLLFAISVDDILKKLEKSKAGCFIGILCCNSFMYADDLILLSLTLKDLQDLVDLCANEFQNIGLTINCNKTFCIRIGQRHAIKPAGILINNKPVDWVSEIYYLGLTVVSSKQFKINLQNRKQKFFRALNAILSRIGILSPPVVIPLVQSQCVPILLYGMDCIKLSKSLLSSLENAYSLIYSKLFRTFDKNIIKQCQFYMGELNAELNIVNRRLNFLSKLSSCNNTYCNLMDSKHTELFSLLCEYNYDVKKLDLNRLHKMNWKGVLFQYFEADIFNNS